jgi:NAD(P)-dependent dehydrogenase (short-subunit alcohol dehydrogenase family)/alkylhydroperoxidase/carboxymuconolactone decarboxylase family protein YurZ
MEIGGRVAVVTGAASGVGRGVAHGLAKAGADLVIADLDVEKLEEARRALAAQGRGVMAIACDVTQDDAFDRLREAADGEFGRTDIVVNNVGMLVFGLPERIPLDEWRRALDVNVLSIVRSLRAFLPAFLEQGHGHVVNTASSAGLFAYSYDRLPYSASKHAIVGLSEALSLYLRPKGIGVSCLCPAAVTGKMRTRTVIEPDLLPPQQSWRPDEIEKIEPEVIGELVVDAIREGRFLILTHPEEAVMLRRRGDSMDAYLVSMAEKLAGAPTGGPQDERGDEPDAHRQADTAYDPEDLVTWHKVVGRAPGPATAQRQITLPVFNKVWSGPDLSTRERRLVTMAVLAVTGARRELDVHIRSALASGDLSARDIEAMAPQLSMYGGWPKGGLVLDLVNEAKASPGLAPHGKH